MSLKTAKQMERHFKGISNHYRIAILLLVSKHKQLTLDQIVEKLKANTKTISGHTQRLLNAGLLRKYYFGNHVIHSLSPYGKKIVRFLEKFQKIA